jgi:hypothetical protein
LLLLLLLLLRVGVEEFDDLFGAEMVIVRLECGRLFG